MKVIDLFAGPGGLAEGFSSLTDGNKQRLFKVALSIEKNSEPFRTLRLRAFYRQFPLGEAPEEYYSFLRGNLKIEELLAAWPAEAYMAECETWQATLGDKDNFPHEKIDKCITNALAGDDDWILIGGPPCQAYSLVGRARNQWAADHKPDDDHAYYYLYNEYIRVVSSHAPKAFVMENVPGLFSVIGSEGPLIDHILERLQNPGDDLNYRLYSMTSGEWKTGDSARDFMIKAEEYGVPQARHRIIIFGVREDLLTEGFTPLAHAERIPLKAIINGLPPLRSGFSKQADSLEAWHDYLKKGLEQPWFRWMESNMPEAAKLLKESVARSCVSQFTRGAEFVTCKPDTPALSHWYHDKRMGGQCNHSSRGHLASDIWRYLFSACVTQITGRSPRLEEYPADLLPAHKNVLKGKFNDRFRVQHSGHPAKTVTSHISQDGHYFIHYDPVQCRSLTVREAARIQTFPDNYFFCGGRTSQYEQVGNAVPPYLAYMIAEKVYSYLKKTGK